MTTLTEAPLKAMSFYSVFASPLGDLILTSNGEGLTGLLLDEPEAGSDPRAHARPDDGPFVEIRRQLQAYFDGDLAEFDVSLALEGTPFQRKVWDELRRIPYGTTISYAELARRVGNPGASRAVGTANGKNPIAVIVPCHRVIASDGSLGGYGGGIDRKQWLLSLEASAGRRVVRR